MNSRYCWAALFLGVATHVSAQSPSAPAQGSIVLPNLNAPENELGDVRKDIIFHKPGVTVEQASKDLSFCWRFLPHGVQRSAPSFVAWQKNTASDQIDYSMNQYGLVGIAIGAIIAGPLERSVRQSRMIRCMVPRGYNRYRTSKDVWKQLNTDDSEQSIRLQAQIAAGPVPPTPKVTP